LKALRPITVLLWVILLYSFFIFNQPPAILFRFIEVLLSNYYIPLRCKTWCLDIQCILQNDCHNQTNKCIHHSLLYKQIIQVLIPLKIFPNHKAYSEARLFWSTLKCENTLYLIHTYVCVIILNIYNYLTIKINYLVISGKNSFRMRQRI
jgi:hypothetical protein